MRGAQKEERVESRGEQVERAKSERERTWASVALRSRTYLQAEKMVARICAVNGHHASSLNSISLSLAVHTRGQAFTLSQAVRVT